MTYSCDFETVNDENDCRVWASGVYCIENDVFIYGNSIDFLMNFMFNSENKDVFYFHNLVFDGDFIMNWLFRNGFSYEENIKYLKENQFNILMSSKGQIYKMTIGVIKNNKLLKIEIRNSLTLLPYSVSDLSNAFGIEELKGSIDYNKKRPEGYKLNKKEIAYLKNDCVIVGKSLQKSFELGLDKLTVGANALSIYTKMIGGKEKFKYKFPPPSYDSDIRPSYKGGWVYANPKYQNKIVGKGIVLDVNSLYPWVLYDCLLPYGEPLYFDGKPKKIKKYPLFVCSFWCSFKLKKDHLPTIQLKGNMFYKQTEYVSDTKSDVVNLCLSSVDYKLFFEHYDVDDISYCGCYYFRASKTMFKKYIDTYMQMKIEAEKNNNSAMRNLAKLMLNNLYGKFSTNPKIFSKIPYLDEKQKINFVDSEVEYREPVYIPIGIFTTAYARYKTITSAQKCYDRFLYADTDSLHLKGTKLPEFLDIDKFILGAWKHEKTFIKAKFLRAKSYLEQDIKTKNIDITCCGMPKHCYRYVTFDNFNTGAVYKGKLAKKRVANGTILNETTFSIR